MDAAQWPQGAGLVKNMEEAASTATCSRPSMEKRTRPPKEQALNCPRCNSTNTKFCYYNNYSLSQPRYFCKTCRRYWTEGGTLRNVPVGGGTRKKQRSSSSISASPASANSNKVPDLSTTSSSSLSSSQNPRIQQGQDLNLGFQTTHGFHMPQFVALPPGSSVSDNHHQGHAPISFSELLRSGISSRGLAPFMPAATTPAPALDPMGAYPSGFGLHDVKPPTINFPLDGLVSGYGSSGIQGLSEGGGKQLFPLMEDMKQAQNSENFERQKGQGDASGYWNGMLGGGSW